jgi:cyclopropane-fatty-acyl-phospholipid synthase
MGDSIPGPPLGDRLGGAHPLAAAGAETRTVGAGEPRTAATEAAAGEFRGAALAAALLEQLFRRVPRTVAVRLWNGLRVDCGSGDAAGAARADPFVLWFRNPEAVCMLVLGRDPLRLAEAYFRGDVDIEGDLFAALVLRKHLQSLRLSLRERVSAVLTALRLRALNRHAAAAADSGDLRHDRAFRLTRSVRAHSKAENRDAIQFHYDVSNEFYRLWLDRAMVYSCGYFERADATLDEAQQAKLEHVCRKLLLRPGERFLDIGCGWGALPIHAAQHHGVQAHGITLSSKQLEIARRRIEEAGLSGRVTVELRDYRDLEGEAVYDKIASIGMFEHVGLRNLPLYFSTVWRLLRPAGLFLNHGITHEQGGWTANLSTEFINRYVFPDGQLDSISNIQKVMEDAYFEITDVEGLRPHYARTLRAWVQRLERRHARALEYVSEATYRVWRLYMSACALEFESAHLGVYQILAGKRGGAPACLPLTRRHLYERAASDPGEPSTAGAG